MWQLIRVRFVLLLAFIVLTSTLFVGSVRIPVAASPANEALTDQQILDRLVRQQIDVIQRNHATWQGEVITSDYRFTGKWAFGIVVVKVPADIHGEPDLRLFLAQRTGEGQWQAALEYTDPFYTWAAQIPDTLIGAGQKQALQNAGQAVARRNTAPRGDGDARLSLPWSIGTTWLLLGGPHGNNGDAVRPWTALDFNIDISGSSDIRAAREGYVYRSDGCPNYVRVDHADGWQTGYYHVKNPQVSNGQYVDRGAWIGSTSAQVGCGGWASGPHVHFTLKFNGVYQNIDGHDLGGWTIYEGANAYDGCMVRIRDHDTECKPGGQIYNDGSIGSGYVDHRYDYNQDAIPDIWAVNQRDSGTNSTSFQIASGSSLQSILISTSTGMPQQPDWLNTAFASADYDSDNVPDLWVLHRWDSAGHTAFRIMNGAAPQYLMADKITALPLYDNSVAFAVADYNRDGTPDLWAINPRDSAKNAISVQIINGASPTEVMAYSGIPLPVQSQYSDLIYAAADYDLDGMPDLWVINPRDNTTKSVSVRIFSGANWQKLLQNSATPLSMQSTNIFNFSILVADYNNDSYPDLWLYNRKSSSVKVISGKNMTKELFNGGTLLPVTSNADWAILGSDRSREMIAPAAAKPNRPKAGSQVNAPDVGFRWKQAALASRYVVTVQVGGVNVASKEFPNVDAICSGKWCSTTADGLGLVLQDNTTYTWSVTASNTYGSTGSVSYTFTTEIPGVPTLISPSNEVAIPGNVALVWSARPAATSYKVLLKNVTATFKKKFVVDPFNCTSDTCTQAVPELLPVDHYFWKVIAKNSTVNGKSASEKAYFSVIDLPTVMPSLTNTPQPTGTTEPPTITPTSTEAATEPPFPTVTPSFTPSDTPNAPIDLPTAG